MIEGARYYLYLVPCEDTKQHIFCIPKSGIATDKEITYK